MTNMKELSSPFTFFYKYIFILIWIVGFGRSTQAVLLAGPADPKWLPYMGVWVMISLFIFFSSGNVKKVSLGGGKIQVSNFLRTVEIDVSEIESIDGSSYLSPRLLWFNLKTKSAFGTKISFLPVFRPSKGIGKHPLIHELAKELDL